MKITKRHIKSLFSSGHIKEIDVGTLLTWVTLDLVKESVSILRRFDNAIYRVNTCIISKEIVISLDLEILKELLK